MVEVIILMFHVIIFGGSELANFKPDFNIILHFHDTEQNAVKDVTDKGNRQLRNWNRRALGGKGQPDSSVDQSCTSAEDCSKDCKMCDGLTDIAECLCKRGNCKISANCGKKDWRGVQNCRYCGEEDCEDDGLCHWYLGQCMPEENHGPQIPQGRINLDKKPLKDKCVKDGKCININVSNMNQTKDGDGNKIFSNLSECHGKCINIEKPCDGQCPRLSAMCVKDGKCVKKIKNKTRVWKTCHKACIETSAQCDGTCDTEVPEQCEMKDGSCAYLRDMDYNRFWKNCKGKCIKTTSTCKGSCDNYWENQCKKDDGSCAYFINIGKKDLNFGICKGKCTESIAWNATEACHGGCDPIMGTQGKLENGNCYYRLFPVIIDVFNSII